MDGKNIKEFPDVVNKLSAPYKKSQFEKQRAEAEAKRKREEAENEAALQDFVKSFDDEDDNPNAVSAGPHGGGYGYGQQLGPPRRQQYGSGMPTGGRGGLPSAQGRGMSSGPGSLGPPPQSMGRSGPGSLGPPPPSRGFNGGMNAFERPPPPPRGPSGGYGQPPPRGPAAAFERYDQPPQPSRNRDHNPRRSFYDDIEREPRQQAPRSKMPAAFSTSDDEDDRSQSTSRRAPEPEVAKPTIQMSNLPPGTSPAAIKALLPSGITVEGVRIMPPTGAASVTERKSMSAIVTLSKETAASDIDSAVSQLRDHYLGYGFYLSLSRHLSTAALSSAPIPSLTTGQTATQPFGAKQAVIEDPVKAAHMHAPPGSYRGIAPPSSYHAPAAKPTGPVFHVPVQPPSDIRELRLIHKTLENLLTHGPEFEALLMSRPDVQREEKWAWIWDARSVGGIWYRWRLWELLTGAENKPGRYLPVFEDMPAWRAPEKELPFQYVTSLEEFVEEDEYNSSSEDESDNEDRGRDRRGMEITPKKEETETFLNPLQKAHFTHLLARLPSNVQKLRRGDVARVTAFALKMAKRGAGECVDMCVRNVLRPYSATGANPAYEPSEAEEGEGEGKGKDTSAASLVGLRLIPDIIASALNSGVSSARVYRQLFEKTIDQRRVFERLGKLDRKMGWGRMSTEKWKTNVKGELNRWKDSCLFMPGAPEAWLETFLNPKISPDEEAQQKHREEEEERRKKESRWKAVKEGEAKAREVEMADAPQASVEVEEEEDGAPMEDEELDGVPMEEDNGAPMEEDEDLDGAPMAEDAGEPMVMDEDDSNQASPPLVQSIEQVSEIGAGPAIRRRPRAEDMFADSGSEGEDK